MKSKLVEDGKKYDAATKLKIKSYTDKKHHAEPSKIQVKDLALVKQYKSSKLSTNYDI